jgi:hypothetical protein
MQSAMPSYLTLPILSCYQLGANGNAQQIYELTFILWTLSLGCEEKDLPLFLSAGKKEIQASYVSLHSIAEHVILSAT